MREVFSTHLSVILFGSEAVTNYKKISILAADNLRELLYKCQTLVRNDEFKQAVATAAGVDAETLDKALQGTFSSPQQLFEVLVALNQVYKGLVVALPSREYQRVSETGAIEEPAIEESSTV